MTNEALIPDTSDVVSNGGQTQLQQPQALRDAVEHAMENYFRHLDGQMVTDVYDMVLSEIEAPMLEVVMKHTRHNQTRAAQLLGLNRGTLRKKLKRYGLL
ncbi:DNA-binding transcriptional regulator Fis [Microbulbifer agarilyticus]|uniref:DNA-binding transcriptional regulator Fis n=1 Tax=Microbulbifer agarilyticus TaxID=260552 RepID=UPI001C95DE58|nr:DNA-binding transcriptional regulator Fis [Microbulbifer agarilyticus]MBY6211863.1 DNA-binding transcriptional regulator Fis [Microbulbifer agarilyticus]